MDAQRLLKAAYAAPSTGDIGPLLSLLCDVTKQDRATYNEYLESDTLPRTLVSRGLDDDTSTDFLNRHHRDNVWRHGRCENTQLNQQLFHANRDISLADQRESAWYQDFMARHHMADAFSVCAQQSSASHVALTVISATDTPRFDPSVLQQINAVYPELNQALDLFHRLRSTVLERQFYETTSCSKQQAHVLLDNFGRIVQCTDDAMDILQQNDGITTDSGHLKLHDLSLDQRLGACFRQTLDAMKGRSLPKPLAVDRPSGDTPYVLDFCPWVVAEGAHTHNEHYVLITLFTPDKKPDLRAELVQAAYGLSSAETRVVSALVNGLDLKEIAAANNITVYTVRNHLKSVFAKTGFKRQGELIGKLVSFIAE